MKLSKQVCSLELAKKLKKLKVEQKSLFSHYVKHYSFGIIETEKVRSVYPVFGVYSAFTVAELGEMLPVRTHTIAETRDKRSKNQLYKCEYDVAPNYHSQYAETEADCRAKMLIYIIEQKLKENRKQKVGIKHNRGCGLADLL